MSDTQIKVLALILAIGFLGLSLWLTISIWTECKEAGYSTLYCLKVIGR